MTPKEEDHHHHHNHHHQQLFLYQSSSSSSSSSFSPATFDYHQPDMKTYASEGGSSCNHHHNLDEKNELKFTIWKKEETTPSTKWMSSKMRLMKKMIHNNSPHHHNNNQFSSAENSSIRFCADCNTTKTPLWRSGPRGPKSLCNACGIRQRKARRAAAAAAGGDTPVVVSKKSNKVQQKDKTANSCLPFKKRCKITTPTPTSSSTLPNNINFDFEELSKISSYQRVFPQDEKEAAVLLMALSYGLVHS